MTEVGATIDLAERRVCFSKLHVTVPLLMINGHIAIDITEFKQFAEHVSFSENDVMRVWFLRVFVICGFLCFF